MTDFSRGGMDAPATSKLVLARVESYVNATDPITGQELLDAAGNAIPTGLVNIVLLETDSSRRNVPYVLPIAGNTLYLGGRPEINTICVVGWRQQNDPIILGFLPPSIDKLIVARQTLPNLREGEIFLQSSSRDVDADNKVNFFRGAQVYLDRYGRIQIDLQDYNLTVGYLLSNENTSNVTFVLDPVTNENVFLRERLPGGSERSVDDKGNAVWTYGGRCYLRAANGYDAEIKGENRQVSTSILITDEQGNGLKVQDGIASIISSGSGDDFNQGSQDVAIGGNYGLSVLKSKDEVIGEDSTTSVAGNSIESVEEEKIILADDGIVLETVGLSPVSLGNDAAESPVPLGDVLKTALNELVTILSGPTVGVVTTGTGTGGIVAIDPAMATKLSTWIVRYLNTVATNILSRKVFVERGSEGV